MEAFEKTELIDRYIKNKLSDAELALFEEQIQKEPALQKEVELQRTAIQAVKVAEIRNILKRTHQQLTEENLIYSGESQDAFYVLKALASDVGQLKEEFNDFKIVRTADSKPSGYVFIAYEGDPAPPFKILSADSNPLFPFVKISPASGARTYHYQLKHSKSRTILHLYGFFNPADLTFIYQEQAGKAAFKLRVVTNEYSLQINKLAGPLPDMNEPL